MLKKILKWVVVIVAIVVGLTVMTDAFQGLSGASSNQDSTSSANPPAWNLSDVNSQTNGNLPIAAVAIKSLSPANGIQHHDPAAVIKTPWKYYGQLLCYFGAIDVVDDYPAGSNLSRALQSDETGEIVLSHEDGTILDFLTVGGTVNYKVGQTASLCGLPIGRMEVPNRLGGAFTHLMFVGFVGKQ